MCLWAQQFSRSLGFLHFSECILLSFSLNFISSNIKYLVSRQAPSIAQRSCQIQLWQYIHVLINIIKLLQPQFPAKKGLLEYDPNHRIWIVSPPLAKAMWLTYNWEMEANWLTHFPLTQMIVCSHARNLLAAGQIREIVVHLQLQYVSFLSVSGSKTPLIVICKSSVATFAYVL